MINIPFNFQPDSVVTVSGGGYTIPAGYYAQVVVSCNQNGFFSIGGTTVLQATNNPPRSIAVGATITTTTQINNAPSGDFVFEGTLRISTSGGGLWYVQVGGVTIDTIGSAGEFEYELKVGSDDDITLTEISGTAILTYTLVGYEYSKSEVDTPQQAQYWLPSGTSIIASTATAVVSLFKEIS